MLPCLVCGCAYVFPGISACHASVLLHVLRLRCLTCSPPKRRKDVKGLYVPSQKRRNDVHTGKGFSYWLSSQALTKGLQAKCVAIADTNDSMCMCIFCTFRLLRSSESSCIPAYILVFSHFCPHPLLLPQAKRRAEAADAELQYADAEAEARVQAAEKRAAEATAALERAERRAAAAERELEVADSAAEARARAAETKAAEATVALEQAKRRAEAADRELEVADSLAEARAVEAERRAAEATAALARAEKRAEAADAELEAADWVDVPVSFLRRNVLLVWGRSGVRAHRCIQPSFVLPGASICAESFAEARAIAAEKRAAEATAALAEARRRAAAADTELEAVDSEAEVG
eukprot:1151724-Pelagomonas_calceolata.AAC.3